MAIPLPYMGHIDKECHDTLMLINESTCGLIVYIYRLITVNATYFYFLRRSCHFDWMNWYDRGDYMYPNRKCHDRVVCGGECTTQSEPSSVSAVIASHVTCVFTFKFWQEWLISQDMWHVLPVTPVASLSMSGSGSYFRFDPSIMFVFRHHIHPHGFYQNDQSLPPVPL